MRLKHLAILGIGLVFSFASVNAQATITASAMGGLSWGSGDGHNGAKKSTPLVSGEMTYGLSNVFGIGAFYDHNFLNSSVNSTTGSLNFYGIVARIELVPLSSLFLDAKLGLNQSSLNGVNSDSAIGFGAGVSYGITLVPMLVELKPRFGLRSLTNKLGTSSTTRTMLDFGLMLSLSL